MQSKILVVFLFLVMAVSAQEKTVFTMEGVVMDTAEQPLAGAKIVVKQNGKKLTKQITEDKGSYTFEVEVKNDAAFQVIYSMKKFSKKIIQFEIEGIPADTMKMPWIDIELIPNKKGQNLRFLKKEPIAIFTYNSDYRTFVLNREHAQQMREKIEGAKK